jgi:hypothetical protein
LLSILFVFACSSSPEGNKSSCSDNSGCETSEVCFYGSCFKEGDKAMGVKTIQIVGGARLELVDGDVAPLRVQVILSGTDEMKEAFSEDDLKKIVGPIEGETVNFKFNIDGLESELSKAEIVTDEFGMGVVDLSAINTSSSAINFNVSAATNNCELNGKCSKSFLVEISKRDKSLFVISSNPLEFYANSHRTLIAKLTTNGGLPYSNQDVTFSLSGNAGGSTLKDASDHTGNTLTVKTDFAGTARVTLDSGESAAVFGVDVTSSGTQAISISVTVRERVAGGCDVNEDCLALGDAYQCEQGVCVYVPIPCDSDADCPADTFECKDSICVEKPYVCGEDGTDLESCRCSTDLNCPETYQCVRGRCVEQNIDCVENIDCPNGLVCRDLTCQPNHTECKMDINCHDFKPEMCPDEDSCVCREGLCVNPCPDTEYIELSGGSGSSCSSDSQCQDNEVCFKAHGVNKCIVKWDANYYFHLIDALPPTLQSILNGMGSVLGPISDILLGENIDWGLPGWLSWLEETIVAAVRPLIDQYIPAWAQDLMIGLNDTIEILQEMKVKVRMSFVHDPIQHSSIKGFEVWESFFVQWHGSWTEVEPTDGEGFQLNSSAFTGSIACQLDDGNPIYSVYIDEHSAEFYFGRFVTAFLDGVLIPAVTSDQAHSLGEAVELYVDCRSIAEAVVDTVGNIVGDWASSFITVSTVEGLCHTGVNLLVDKVNDYINQLHFGDAQGGSDAFKFGGFATIEAQNTEGKKLKEGKYTGTLNLGGERAFTADWDAEKAR